MPTMATVRVERMISRRSRAVGGASRRLDRHVSRPCAAAASAWSRSQMMSSGSSRPTEMRMRSGGTPAASSASSRQLPVRGARRVDHQRAHVADVGQVAAQLQRLDERAACGAAAGDAEREHGPRALAAGSAAAQRVVGMVGAARPSAPTTTPGVGGEEVGDGGGVGEVGVHPLGQRLHPLHQQEGVERRQRRADVAELLGTQARAERVLAEVAPPRQAAVRGDRLGHPREVAVAPVEAPGFDHHPAERGAVAAEELGGRVHDDVGAPLDRPAQVRRRHGRVDDQRDPGAVGDRRRGPRGRRRHRTGWRRPRCRSAWCWAAAPPRSRRPGRRSTRTWSSTPKRASVPSSRVRVPPYSCADETMWSPASHSAADRQELGRLAAGRRHRADAAFEAGDALLERGDGGIADAAVDVPVLLQGEQIGGVGGVLEHEAGRLEDRHRAGPR